jgi:hypothetical protein
MAIIDFVGPIYAGVIVLPSPSMARKLSADVPQLAVPDEIIGQLDRDRGSGVDIACDHIKTIYESEAFEGVHLIPVNCYREMAARLKAAVVPHPTGSEGMAVQRRIAVGYSARPSPEVRRTRVRCCRGLEMTMPSRKVRPRCHR